MRAIAPLLLGQKLVSVEAFVPKLRYPMPDVSDLAGRKVLGLARRAKYILMEVEGDETLVIHLGMSGRLTVERPEKHGHFVMRTAAHEVYLHDPRRFGLVLRLQSATIMGHPLLAGLGPEPLEDSFDAKVLKRALANIKGPIKPALMNPKVVVGVGNIYASESLFEARIRPTRPAHSLTMKECERLVAAIKAVLLRAIGAGGSSLRDFAHPSGELGNFQSDFYVYGRKDQPCRVCGRPIEQMVQAQRTTYFCTDCQQ